VNGKQQLLADIIGGVVAVALIVSHVVLASSHVADPELGQAVPVLLAFYFGGRITAGVRSGTPHTHSGPAAPTIDSTHSRTSEPTG
jgi:hypothetical protein